MRGQVRGPRRDGKGRGRIFFARCVCAATKGRSRLEFVLDNAPLMLRRLEALIGDHAFGRRRACNEARSATGFRCRGEFFAALGHGERKTGAGLKIRHNLKHSTSSTPPSGRSPRALPRERYDGGELQIPRQKSPGDLSYMKLQNILTASWRDRRMPRCCCGAVRDFHHANTSCGPLRNTSSRCGLAARAAGRDAAP